MKAHFTRKLKTPKSLKALAPGVFAQLGFNDFFDHRILFNWGQIVGPDYSKACQPLKISRTAQAGAVNAFTLVLYSDNPSFCSKFSFHKPVIEQRLRTFFGSSVQNMRGISLQKSL